MKSFKFATCSKVGFLDEETTGLDPPQVVVEKICPLVSHLCWGQTLIISIYQGMVINPIILVYIPIIRIPIFQGGRDDHPQCRLVLDAGTFEKMASFKLENLDVR